MGIKELITELSSNPFSPELNLKIADEYEHIGQTASAVSFYLRTAEYGYYTHYDHVYAALLKTAQCFSSQQNRENTVQNLYYKAIAYLPNRPEAWFLFSRYFEQNKKWQESYTYAEVGLALPEIKHLTLPIWVDYPGRYGLTFEKAVAAWWVGRKDEAVTLLIKIVNTPDIHQQYLNTAKVNLKNLGHSLTRFDPLEPVVTNYRKFFNETASLIVEVGTRDGDDANYLFKELNAGKVIAIDANPIAVDITRSKYPWMSVVYAAASDTKGEIVFNQVTSPDKEIMGTSSIFSKDKSVSPPPEYYEGLITQITVPTERMDSILKEEPIIDVVKIDTEGYSWQVLQGFGDRLKDVKLLHIETEQAPVHDDHVTTEKIVEFMEANGFALVDISHEWGWLIQDQVWVNKALVLKNKECFNNTGKL
ncbi:Methyltransferase FkbM [uncultured Caudovirales phage]|uniref:Methyltransferase FkbM n=1 Tax=uncultured Caudovirales phage TaxID=2100421 RepID=A0A6J5P513_9CAUD|nr:Methyltransferase FkbM [uncultured Caudovirales phage]CAB4173749.1 Methyltransferase FkbM [uncultured Caudovirales phage]CAB4179562.1 Methyltransferase FkbM [uncultured Caudovirales phage]CAB4189194.1 Methyltransferase FkbM [uncultured Caudovirales phage]CAB4193722.1 Methyltransferase FkbM [uncultured Caudovirales phage]